MAAELQVASRPQAHSMILCMPFVFIKQKTHVTCKKTPWFYTRHAATISVSSSRLLDWAAIACAPVLVLLLELAAVCIMCAWKV